MPHAPHIIRFVEDALSDCFNYHHTLDSFILSAGVSTQLLTAARLRADTRNSRSTRPSNRAPKRLVVQEVLVDLRNSSPDNDRIIAALITGLCNGEYRDATPNSLAAINSLKAARNAEVQQSAQRRAEREQEKRDAERSAERQFAAQIAKRADFRDKFIELIRVEDPQQRGYLLERFLNEYLQFEGLDPRSSFKLKGEQIDGSFSWSSRTHLVEAKWVKQPVGADGFSGLIYKIEGKTADTRGLFLSINGYSPDAILGLRTKGNLRFICIDGAHLMRAFEYEKGLPRLLEILWRHANETGEAYVPVSAPAFISRNG